MDLLCPKASTSPESEHIAPWRVGQGSAWRSQCRSRHPGLTTPMCLGETASRPSVASMVSLGLERWMSHPNLANTIPLQSGWPSTRCKVKGEHLANATNCSMALNFSSVVGELVNGMAQIRDALESSKSLGLFISPNTIHIHGREGLQLDAK